VFTKTEKNVSFASRGDLKRHTILEIQHTDSYFVPTTKLGPFRNGTPRKRVANRKNKTKRSREGENPRSRQTDRIVEDLKHEHVSTRMCFYRFFAIRFQFSAVRRQDAGKFLNGNVLRRQNRAENAYSTTFFAFKEFPTRYHLDAVRAYCATRQ